MSKALLVIDVRNDYFADGKFPLWYAEIVSENVEKAIRRAKANGIPVIYVQHVVKQEPAPFFGEKTPGVEINSRNLVQKPCRVQEGSGTASPNPFTGSPLAGSIPVATLTE